MPQSADGALILMSCKQSHCSCGVLIVADCGSTGCHLELPVSTTHTTVGATVGMALVLQGAGAVAWNQRTNEFPFFTGISAVVASWWAATRA